MRKAILSSNSLELPPDILPIIPEKNKTFGESAANVKVGLYVHNFPQFNMLEGNFSLDGMVWFEFNPSQVSLVDLEKFEFFEGTIIQKSVEQVKRIRNKIFVAYNFKVAFTSRLNYQKFPFDGHRIFLILKNSVLSARELHFSPLDGSIRMPQELQPMGWKIKNTKVEAGTIKVSLEHGESKKTMFIPVTVFEFDCKKSGYSQIINTFMPIMLLFYLALLSLVFDVKFSLEASLGSLSALIIYRYYLAIMSPKIGYSTTLDNIYILILSLSFLIFIFHIYDLGQKNIMLITSLSFYTFQIAVVLACWFFLRVREGTKKIDFFYFPKIIRKDKSLLFPRLLKLKSFQKITDDFDEFLKKDHDDHLFIDYSRTIFEKRTRGFSQISKKIMDKVGLDVEELSPSYFKKIIESYLIITVSKDFNPAHILLHPLTKDEEFYIWGDLQGAFHSLVRTLNDLKEKNIMGDDFQIVNPHHYFIFNGNVIGRSAYNLETLSLIITLILKNPQNVIYLKGPHEEKRFWLNLGLRNELEILEKDLSFEETALELLISQFFSTLPETLYLAETKQEINKYITISPRSPYFIDSEILRASLHDKLMTSFQAIEVNNQRSKKTSLLIVAHLRGIEDEIRYYRELHGVDLLPPEGGATHWSIFSSPLEAHQEHFNFNFDAYAILKVSTSLNESVLTRVTRELRKENHFHETNFDLLSGVPLDISSQQRVSFEPEYEVRMGSTLDLTETSSILGERLRRGLDLRIRKANKEGGLNGGFLRLFFANDKYTPSLTLQNVQRFISEDKTTLILSPLGTPTTKSLVPLSEKGKILVLFPYTGGNIFRAPELKNFINYRASYAEEASTLVRYARDVLFSQRYAFFFQDDDYGRTLLNAAKKILIEQYNIPEDAICEASYQRNTVLVDRAAMKIEQFTPDVIFFFSTYPPSRALIEKIGVQKLSNVNLMGISFLTDRFQEYASGILDPEQQGKGLNFIISRVVPNPENSTIEIVKEYQIEMAREYPDVRLDVDSLEGYINASILLYILESIDRPYSHEKILQVVQKIKNLNFKGLILNFDPQTQSLSKNVWLDLGDGEWI
ncbi:MAG: ABC transporter substrate-binding protein [Alphaproteobacteria bacterium]|nr:ABC transporter substrate-binding protein [Alphaproteobacteria bacterium]